MRFEVWMENLIIPFGQSVLYDLSKEILSQFTEKYYLEKTFNTAISNGVNSVFKKGNHLMAENIIESIKLSCKGNQKPDLNEIVKREFQQWGEENLNSKIVASNICDNILHNIMKSSELCEIFTFKILNELTQEYTKLYNEIKNERNNCQKSLKDIKDANNDMMSLLNELYKDVQQIRQKMTQINQTVATSECISYDYKNYFLKPLCFEKNLKDGKIATLKDVYIENDYYILDFPFHNKNKPYSGLINFINDFIICNLTDQKYHTAYSFATTHIRVLFIKGHPGCGKSSLFYYLAYLKSQNENFFPHYKFYFVKFIEIYNITNGNINVNNPMEDIEKVIKSNNPFKMKSVLILDGLDEICVAKNLDIKEYCNNLIRITTGKNNLKLIITTRLNYVNISNSDNKNVFNIQLLNLSISDSKRWLQKYFDIHKNLIEEKCIAEKNIEYITKNRYENFTDIFAIPFLFYMIITSKIDISTINSVGELYDRVFHELKERNYNESDIDFIQKHGINNKIPENLARQIAIEISFEMYKTNDLLLKINSEELNSALKRVRYSDYNIKNSDKDEIEHLFPITFYYKESIDVVEFAHKSIMEFFVAEKMYQEINHYSGKVNQYIKDYMINPVIISSEVLQFLNYFFASNPKRFEKIDLFSNILSVFEDDLRFKNDYSNSNVKYSFETSKLIFKIYWYFIRKLINCKIEDINQFIKKDIVKDFITSVITIKDSNSIPLLSNNVIEIDFSGLYFEEYNFSFSNLSYVNFSNVKLKNCNFSYANLNSAILRDIFILGDLEFLACSFNYATLKNFKLNNNLNNKKEDIQHKIELKGCTFDFTTFENLDISQINISSIVSMKSAKFKNVQMSVEQFINLSSFPIKPGGITILLQKSDFSQMELKEIDNQKKLAFQFAKLKIHNRIGRKFKGIKFKLLF